MKKQILFVILIIVSICILSAYVNTNEVSTGESYKEHTPILKVVIDAGHGGQDVGAIGDSGQYEKNFTLSVAKKVVNLLEQEPQIQVYMTRADDSFISQESRYRPKYANKLNADLFISIHGNTFSDSNVSGTETFYYHENSQTFAKAIQKHVAEATGFKDRGTTKKDLFVVKDTKMPSALIEVGYLTNPQDESKMWTDDFQNRVATSIVEGIKDYRAELEKQDHGIWFF